MEFHIVHSYWWYPNYDRILLNKPNLIEFSLSVEYLLDDFPLLQSNSS